MLHFSIRELVLLTLTVAIGVGWWVDRTRQQLAHAAEMERAGAKFRITAQHFASRYDELYVLFERREAQRKRAEAEQSAR